MSIENFFSKLIIAIIILFATKFSISSSQLEDGGNNQSNNTDEERIDSSLDTENVNIYVAAWLTLLVYIPLIDPCLRYITSNISNIVVVIV